MGIKRNKKSFRATPPLACQDMSATSLLPRSSANSFLFSHTFAHFHISTLSADKGGRISRSYEMQTTKKIQIRCHKSDDRILAEWQSVASFS